MSTKSNIEYTNKCIREDEAKGRGRRKVIVKLTDEAKAMMEQPEQEKQKWLERLKGKA